MITLPDGTTFRYMFASGSLGWAGNDEGHGLARLWKWPWRALGLLRPEEVPHALVVIKTLSPGPVQGRLTLTRPWYSVRPWRGGLVNAVALTGPGLPEWIRRYYPVVKKAPYKVAVSITADHPLQASAMATRLRDECPAVCALELNPFCPNVSHQDGLQNALDTYGEVRRVWRRGLVVKLGYQDDYLKFLDAARDLDAVHLINAVPWDVLYPWGPYQGGPPRSPLEKYGYKGSVSGPEIAHLARLALKQVLEHRPYQPVVSGGGIRTFEEALGRFQMGARAIAFGSCVLRTPDAPLHIAQRLETLGATAGVPREFQCP